MLFVLAFYIRVLTIGAKCTRILVEFYSIVDQYSFIRNIHSFEICCFGMTCLTTFCFIVLHYIAGMTFRSEFSQMVSISSQQNMSKGQLNSCIQYNTVVCAFISVC